MSDELTVIERCEVCGNGNLAPVLDLGPQPLCDDLVPLSDARVCREYPVEILFCERCATAHQKFQVPKHLLFPETYHYRSRFTADVLNGMAGLVDACAMRIGRLDGKCVLDVGCNDGSLLDFFAARGARTCGIEPTDAASEARHKGHQVIQGFFDRNSAADIVTRFGHPDVVVFTNVFAHIEDLDEVLGSLDVLMSPDTLLIVENHYLGSVLGGHQFDTFYHEHARTYSRRSFVHIARRLGRELIETEFPSRYGGNIRVYIGPQELWTPAAGDGTDIADGDMAHAFRELARGVDDWRESTRSMLAALVDKHGPLSAKAFPGRAAILIKLLGVGTETFAAVYEKPGSLKIGYYVPATRIPIRSDNELPATDFSAPIVNLAWHIPGEIRVYLSKLGYGGEVIDIVRADQFRK